MHLVEILALRSVPAAGVSLGLTRRCPLSCEHCSTNSTTSSEQYPEGMFVRFVKTFTANHHPEILSMSGGEALLRPGLVRKLAEIARTVGTRSAVLSGMHFATAKSVPPKIREAIAAVDHFSASIDEFHEREVPRANVFRVLDGLLAAGTDVSLHLVCRTAHDPYINALIAEVHKLFHGTVPMLVNTLSYFGRATEWLTPPSVMGPAEVEANPCAMAAWPVVGFDGTIVTCGNDTVLDKLPPHLRLGHAASDDWATIQARCVGSPAIRAIRLFGPQYVSDRLGGGCDGYCESCMKLSGNPAFEENIGHMMAKPSMAVLEEQVSTIQKQAGALGFARRHGVAQYADLVALGAPHDCTTT
jgi:pyruvate-formate lyase-activating enzyme